jgi:hypothetical protein
VSNDEPKELGALVTENQSNEVGLRP